MSLRFGILGLLAEKPLHGYEVKTRFESLLGGTWEVNIGQIYSTLQRLERDGLVAPADWRMGTLNVCSRTNDGSTCNGSKTSRDWSAGPATRAVMTSPSLSGALFFTPRPT